MVNKLTTFGQLAYYMGKYTYHMKKFVGTKIKELRENREWSQGYLAGLIGVSRSAVTQWENGSTKNVRDDNLVALARVFGTTIDELLTSEAPTIPGKVDSEHGITTQTKEEEVLLMKFRHLNSDDRARIQKIIIALDAEPDSKVGGQDA